MIGSSLSDAKNEKQISATLVLDGMIDSELINYWKKLNIQEYFVLSSTIGYSMHNGEQSAKSTQKKSFGFNLNRGAFRRALNTCVSLLKCR